LPVSVPGIVYDLYTATTPDPNQVIRLSIEQASSGGSTASVTPEVTPTPFFKVGDTVSVETSVILDHNGHQVPDGTPVLFKVALPGVGGVVQQINTTTLHGIAGASFSIDRTGLLEIRAESDPALTSEVVQLNVTGEGFSLTIIAPTPIISETPPPVPTVTPTLTPSSPATAGSPGLGGWFVMLLILAGLGMLAVWFGKQALAFRWAVRWALCIITGGLLAYSYLAVRLPGATAYLQRFGWVGIIWIVLIGAVAGTGAAYAWWQLSNGSSKQPD